MNLAPIYSEHSWDTWPTQVNVQDPNLTRLLLFPGFVFNHFKCWAGSDTLRPACWCASASCTATVDFPTPPFPEKVFEKKGGVTCFNSLEMLCGHLYSGTVSCNRISSTVGWVPRELLIPESTRMVFFTPCSTSCSPPCCIFKTDLGKIKSLAT